jgi:hypothetical protein
MSKEVFQVIVDIELPSPRCPQGRTALGYYVVEGDQLTMTCPKGEPAFDAAGKLYTAQLAANDNPRTIAGRLTKQLYNALRGDRPKGFGGSGSGFNRELNYNNKGIV